AGRGATRKPASIGWLAESLSRERAMLPLFTAGLAVSAGCTLRQGKPTRYQVRDDPPDDGLVEAPTIRGSGIRVSAPSRPVHGLSPGRAVGRLSPASSTRHGDSRRTLTRGTLSNGGFASSAGRGVRDVARAESSLGIAPHQARRASVFGSRHGRRDQS